MLLMILQKKSKFKKIKYKDFSLFDTSLSMLICLMVANKQKDISKIILNTTGSDIAKTVWIWDFQNLPFKKELLKQKLTFKDLRNI